MKLRARRESERIKKRSLMAGAFKPNQRGAQSENVSKKRLEYKKQKLRRGLEEQQHFRKCLQGINKPKTVANQNLPKIGKSEEILYVKQKNMNIVKSSGRRKKKTSEVENAVLAKKCKTDASYKSKRIDSITLANKNVFKIGGLQENLNTKQRHTNSVIRSLKGKNKINVAKLKHGSPKGSNESNKQVKSCLKNVDKVSAPKCLSNKQENFPKIDPHLVPCKKLRNQQKQGNKKEPRKSSRSTYLVKTRSKTNTSAKSKKSAPAHGETHQHKLKQNILPENQKSKNLSSQRQNLNSVNKKWKKTSKYQDNMPLIDMLQKHTIVWPDSNQLKSEGFMVKEEQKLFKLGEISEKRGMQARQKTVKKRKVVHKDKVLDPCFALKQSIKDLKAQNSRLRKEINNWHKRGKVPSSKKHCVFCKKKAIINHSVISKNSCSIQIEVQTLAAETQTEISFTLQEYTIQNVQDNYCSIQTVAAETQTEIAFALQEDTIQVQDIAKNDIASLNDIIENQGELAAAGSDNKENFLGSNSDYGNLESNEDFNAKIDLEESRIKYDVCLAENNTESADHHRSSQNFCHIEVKNGGISKNLEPLWNPKSSSEMVDIKLLRSKEEPEIVEIDCDKAQYIHTVCLSQTEEPKLVELDCDEVQCSHAVCLSQTDQPKLVELDCDEAQCSHVERPSQTEPKIVEIDCDEAQCSHAVCLSQTDQPKLVELDCDEAQCSHVERPSQTEPKIVEIDCDEAQCSHAVCLSQTDQPKLVELDCDEAQYSHAVCLYQTDQPKLVELDCDEQCSHAVCPSQTEPKIVEISCNEAHCSHAVCLSQTSLSIRQENLHQSQIMKVEAQRDSCSLLQHNQLLRNSNSHATQRHDTGTLSFSSNNLVYTSQAAIPQPEEWMCRPSTLCNGYTVTEYVRPPQVNYIANSSFVVNIQQAVVKLAEDVGQQPLQQVSPNVFIYDPLTGAYK